MKNLILILSWIFMILGITYCFTRLVGNLDYLQNVHFNTLMLFKLLIMVCVFTISFVFLSEGWRLLLSMGGVSLSIRQSFAIMGISQIGKYIPGNVFQFIGRVGIGIRQGVSSYVLLSASVWLETLFLLVASCVIIIVGATIDLDARIWMTSIFRYEFTKYFLFLLGLIIATFLGWQLLRKKLEFYTILCKPSLAIKLISYYLVFIIISGCIVKFIPTVIWGSTYSSFSFFQVIWRYSLCWLAGLIVPGAPAGLGVREAFFVKLFSPELGEGGAACVALVFRVLTTAGDLMIFAMAWWLGKRVLNKGDSSFFEANNEC